MDSYGGGRPLTLYKRMDRIISGMELQVIKHMPVSKTTGFMFGVI